MEEEFEETKAFLKHYCLTNCGHNANESCICKAALCFKEIENAEKALTELKQIKEAKPSEALILFRSFKKGMITDNAICITKSYFDDKFPVIEQALLKILKEWKDEN